MAATKPMTFARATSTYRRYSTQLAEVRRALQGAQWRVERSTTNPGNLAYWQARIDELTPEYERLTALVAKWKAEMLSLRQPIKPFKL